MGVGRARGPLANPALHTDDELAAQALRLLEHIGGIRVEHDLQESLAIAQIDEDHPAVIATSVDPTRNRDFLAGELFVDLSAVM